MVDYLDEIVRNAKREEKLREKKIGHLVGFLKSNRLSIISDDVATVDKKEVIDTKNEIIIIGDGITIDEDGIEEYVDNYELKIYKHCLLDWEEDKFAGIINLYYIWQDKELVIG
ncbi:hypothetical protein CF067_00740 [Clostridium sporogenes]|nr:hypothetical protein [Clostridium botulinum]